MGDEGRWRGGAGNGRLLWRRGARCFVMLFIDKRCARTCAFKEAVKMWLYRANELAAVG